MKNFDDAVEKYSKKYTDINPLGPVWPFRMLMSGESGCGKTNALLNLILDGYIYYDKIYLYAKNINQPKYTYIINMIKKREKELSIPEGTYIFASSNLEDVVRLSDGKDEKKKRETKIEKAQRETQEALLNGGVKPSKKKGKGKEKSDEPTSGEPAKERMKLDNKIQNLIIFDDFLTEINQSIISNYFIGSRHHNCSCVYISQSYYDTPHMIRYNCDYFCIWRVNSERQVIELAKDHARGVDKNEFKRIYEMATQHQYQFLMIDKKTKEPSLIYRTNFGRVAINQQEPAETVDNQDSDCDSYASTSDSD